jgi:hypothetical protein
MQAITTLNFSADCPVVKMYNEKKIGGFSSPLVGGSSGSMPPNVP